MVFVVSDHGGFALKGRILTWLKRQNYEVRDLGPDRFVADDDYPVHASRLARAVRLQPGNFGIAICRSGVGMALVANKHHGIRAVQALTPSVAVQSRRDENTNILSLAADHQSFRQATRVIRSWLTTPFSALPRHQRRLRLLAKLDHGR